MWIFASQGQAQPGAELTGAFCRNANRARVAAASDPAEGDEALGEFDGDAACEMVVAGARTKHFVAFRRAVEGSWMRFGGDGAEGFEREGHFRSRKFVVAVSS